MNKVKLQPRHHNAYSSVAMCQGYELHEHSESADIYVHGNGMKVAVSESAATIISKSGRATCRQNVQKFQGFLTATQEPISESLEEVLFEPIMEDGVRNSNDASQAPLSYATNKAEPNQPGNGGAVYDNDYAKQLTIQGYSFVNHTGGYDVYQNGQQTVRVGQDVATIAVGDDHHPVKTYDNVTAFTDALANVAGAKDVEGGGTTATTTIASQQPGDPQPDEQDVKPIPPGEKRNPNDGIAGQHVVEAAVITVPDAQAATDKLEAAGVEAVRQDDVHVVVQEEDEENARNVIANGTAAIEAPVVESAPEASAAKKVLNTLKLMGEMGHDGKPTGHTADLTDESEATGITAPADEANTPAAANPNADGSDTKSDKVAIKVDDLVKSRHLLDGASIVNTGYKDTDSGDSFVEVAPTDADKAKRLLADQSQMKESIEAPAVETEPVVEDAIDREHLLRDQLGLKTFDESHNQRFKGLLSVVKRLGDRI